MELRNRKLPCLSANKTAQKRKPKEENVTLERSKAKDKPANKKKRCNGETSGITDDSINCLVCLDTVDSLIRKSLPCAHVFHDICINEWLKNSHNCPICRSTITADTNDSSNETSEDTEDGINIFWDSRLGRWNFDFGLNNWSYEPESEDSIDGTESKESSDESKSEESSDESKSEESSDESKSEESSDESKSEKSSDESKSEEYIY